MPWPNVSSPSSSGPWPPPADNVVVPWSPFAFTPAAAIVDTGSLLVTGSGFDDETGRFTAVFSTVHATAVDGYEEGLARYRVPLLDVFPDFDPAIHVLDLGIDATSFNHAATGAAGVYIGLVDSATIDANLNGQCIAIRCVSAAADLVGRMDNDNIPGFNQDVLRDAVIGSYSIGSDGTDYPLNCSILAKEEGTDNWTPIVAGAGDDMRTTIADWQIIFGAYHGSAVVIPSVTQTVTFYYRVREVEREFPEVNAGTKPTSGTLNVVLIGDSIADGIGADPTGDGSNLLAYGGSALPAGAVLVDEGVNQANYQDNAGAGPDPGLTPHIHRLGLADGFSTVRVVRDSTSGNATSTVRTARLQEAIDTLGRTLQISQSDIHLVVICSGTNDSQAGESTAFAITAPKLVADIRHAFPNARIVWVGPGAADGVGFEDANEVRAIIAALENVSYYDGTQAALHDSSHPSLAGYKTIGEGVWALWEAAP